MTCLDEVALSRPHVVLKGNARGFSIYLFIYCKSQ